LDNPPPIQKGVSMSTRLRIVTAAVALFTLALAGTGQAATPARLLSKFQPVLVYHPGEELRPTTVESFVRDSQLEVATSPTTWVVVNPSPTVGSLPTASPPVWRLNQRDCFAGAPLGDISCYAAAAADEPARVAYGRVARDGERIVLQYWFFYYDDVYRYPFLPVGAIWQSHEGDWEVVNVVLSEDQEPLFTGYSQHCSGETRAWGRTPRWRGTHPKVYVAHGSHANYFGVGLHEFDRSCLPLEVIRFFQQAGLPLPADVTAEGPVGGPEDVGERITIERVTASTPVWMAFPGFWGELEYFHAPPPIDTVPAGTGPVGPAFHRVWRDPLATMAGWR
jgi:hypothetical protein